MLWIVGQYTSWSPRRLDRAELLGGLRHRRFAARAIQADRKDSPASPEDRPRAGHHSVIKLPGQDVYYSVYHRRPLGETDSNHRVICMDRREFDELGFIKPVKITFEGVAGVSLAKRAANNSSQ